MSDTLMGEKVDEKVITTDEGDHDRFAHYFRKSDLDLVFFEGQEITAVCGKTALPNRDPLKYQVCPTCKEIYESMKE